MNQFVPQSTRTAPFGRTSLLIVEDNPDHQHLIKLALARSMPGVQITGVATGQAALEHITTTAQAGGSLPRLILLDLYLPTQADGLQTLVDLKGYFQNRPQPPVPVVMFSFSDRPEDIRLCYDQGANAYMVKSPDYREWLGYFDQLRNYWLHTVTLPRP